jgi:hypothetical protein
VAEYAGHYALIFINHRAQQRIDLIVARIAPKTVERLAFDLACKQRAYSVARKTKPQFVSEIRRQHECIGQ